MAKLRHIAIAVPDPEAAAQFYGAAMKLERVGDFKTQLADGVTMTDGYLSIVFLKYHSDEYAGRAGGMAYIGPHHFGFQTDDLETTGQSIRTHGGSVFMENPGDSDAYDFEVKYRDPNGIIFDISKAGWFIGKT